MKFLELTGYGNKHKHLISLRSIADIEFLPQYTHINLNNGSMVNYLNGDIVSQDYMENLQAQIDAYAEMEADRYAVNNELPF